MIDEQDVKDWEKLPLPSSIITSQYFGAWLYYRDRNRDKRVNSELLDKVAEKLKAKVRICANCFIFGCDTEYFKPMCEKAVETNFSREFCEYVDEVIAEIKAEVGE